jgi:hypothetical protein
MFGPKKERKTIKELLVSSGTYLKYQNQRTSRAFAAVFNTHPTLVSSWIYFQGPKNS